MINALIIIIDDEMLKMNVKCLQKDGVIFLWVTGRAMELGRRCLDAYDISTYIPIALLFAI